MKRFFTALVSSLALVLATGAGVHADPLTPDNVQWTYNFTPSLTQVAAVGTNPSSPSAYLSFVNQASNTPNASGIGTGPTDIVATNIQVTAPSNNPSGYKYTLPSTTFSLALQLTTLEPNAMPSTASLTFKGVLGGTFGWDNASVTTSFVSPYTSSPPAHVQVVSPMEQIVTLGSFAYDVKAYQVTPPGPAQYNSLGGVLGSIAFRVTPEVADGGGSASQVPEPSAMLLSCLGGLSFVGMAWRKRRNRG
jgi:hypothetical protein